jgi:hypothetical protein
MLARSLLRLRVYKLPVVVESEQPVMPARNVYCLNLSAGETQEVDDFVPFRPAAATREMK